MICLKEWERLPETMRNTDVRHYYDILAHKRAQLVLKRFFDIAAGCAAAVLLSPVMLVIAVMIKLDSEGPVMFRQERVTAYGKIFRIFKFRTMVVNAEALGAQVTSKGDSRITRVGRLLRKCRLDELPQVFNIISGDMSFVGTRPEVMRYVREYTDEMTATLLMPAGVTSEASIFYKDEDRLLNESDDTEKTYVNEILPEKMKYNLDYIIEFGILRDIKIMLRTVTAVFIKDNTEPDIAAKTPAGTL